MNPASAVIRLMVMAHTNGVKLLIVHYGMSNDLSRNEGKIRHSPGNPNEEVANRCDYRGSERKIQLQANLCRRRRYEDGQKV